MELPRAIGISDCSVDIMIRKILAISGIILACVGIIIAVECWIAFSPAVEQMHSILKS